MYLKCNPIIVILFNLYKSTIAIIMPILHLISAQYKVFPNQ